MNKQNLFLDDTRSIESEDEELLTCSGDPSSEYSSDSVTNSKMSMSRSNFSALQKGGLNSSLTNIKPAPTREIFQEKIDFPRILVVDS